MWLQGSFLQRETISSRQMMQTLLADSSSSLVTSGYLYIPMAIVEIHDSEYMSFICDHHAGLVILI